MTLTNCNTQIRVSPTFGVWKPYNLYINALIILRLLQGVYNHLTTLQIHGIFNLVAALYETRLLQQKTSIWINHVRNNHLSGSPVIIAV